MLVENELGAELLDACTRRLNDAERERAIHFLSARDRTLFVSAHWLLQEALAEATGRPGIRNFRVLRNGRPVLEPPEGAPLLEFSLSHTYGYALCAVALGRRLGADVETLDPSRAYSAIARRFFTAGEVAQLERIDAASRTEAFFTFWTLKESFLKAIGTGISGGLESCAFTLAHPALIAVPPGEREPAAWQVQTYAPTQAHCVALVVERTEVPLVVVRRLLSL